MHFDVAVVHYEIFREEILECNSIDDVELAVPFETIDHVVNSALKLIPILFIYLHFGLRHAQVFIELFQIVVIVYLVELILLCDLRELRKNLFAELAGLFRKLLLQFEQVPILTHAAQHVIEKVIEVLPQRVTYKDDVISESDFVLREILANLVLDNALSMLDIF